MREAIKLELYRAYHNINYFVALLAGCLITVAQFIFRVLPKTAAIGNILSIDYPYSVFNSCLMFDMGGFYSYLYYFAIILIGTLPFGISYYTDLREGYVKNIYTRTDRKGYLTGKYIAVFTSAGSVCVIPLLLNLLLTSMVLPSLIPQLGTGVFPVGGNSMLKGLFYSHPWIYIGVYLTIEFIMVGLFACMALVAAKVVYNRYIVLFIPFLLFVVMQTVAQYTRLRTAAPYCIMDAGQMTWESAPVICTEMAVLLISTFLPFYLMGGKKRDAL